MFHTSRMPLPLRLALGLAFAAALGGCDLPRIVPKDHTLPKYEPVVIPRLGASTLAPNGEATIAALPLLLIYLQLAWTIALLGAEISYGIANLDQLGRHRRLSAVGSGLRERIGIWLVARACESFGTGSGPQRIAELSAELDVPGEILESIVQDLVGAEVLLEIEGDDPGFVPARLPAQIGVAEVRSALRGELPDDLVLRCALAPALGERLAQLARREGEILAGVDFGAED